MTGTAPVDTAVTADRPIREVATLVVADLARRLARPDRVVAAATAPGNLDRLPGGTVRQPWLPATLGSGHAGIALLFAELARPGDNQLTHAHLQAAVSGVTSGGHGLYHGMAGIGMAAAAAARRTGDYARLLATVDSYVAREARALTDAEQKRIAVARPGESVSTFDLVDGATGLGAYLLRRPGQSGSLAAVLRYLIAMVRPVRVDGREVPGWWRPGSPANLAGGDAGGGPGQLNLGLAHGISGPLALLSLARHAGVPVAGLADAVRSIRNWLADHLFTGQNGPYWPAAVTPGCGRQAVATGDRSAWCYGTPGTAYATHLAALALAEPGRAGQALDLLWNSIDRAETGGVLTDAGLCHGWSGLLAMACQLRDRPQATGPPPPAWTSLADRLAARVMADYQPTAPFGFRFCSPHVELGPDRCGLIEGTAGVALALHTYAYGASRGRHWPVALLLR